MGDSPPSATEILQDRVGVWAPNETRVSRERADPHINSGVRTQTRSAAVEVGVQAIEIETQLSEADFEFGFEFIPAFGPSLCAAGHQLWLFLDLLPEHQPGLMDPSAPPTDQVRTTQVCGGEIPASQNLQHLKKSPSKGVKNTQQNALLQQRKDGSVRLIYSTKTDINYMNYQDRQMLKPVPKEFDMCGLTNLKWASFLSSDSTVRTALTFDPTTEIAQRHHKLNQIKRDELLYQMRQLADPNTGDRFLYADYLTVQVSDGNGTIYEQTAICAAVTRTVSVLLW